MSVEFLNIIVAVSEFLRGLLNNIRTQRLLRTSLTIHSSLRIYGNLKTRILLQALIWSEWYSRYTTQNHCISFKIFCVYLFPNVLDVSKKNAFWTPKTHYLGEMATFFGRVTAAISEWEGGTKSLPNVVINFWNTQEVEDKVFSNPKSCYIWEGVNCLEGKLAVLFERKWGTECLPDHLPPGWRYFLHNYLVFWTRIIIKFVNLKNFLLSYIFVLMVLINELQNIPLYVSVMISCL